MTARFVFVEVSDECKQGVTMFCRRWHQSEPVVIDRLWRRYKRNHPAIAAVVAVRAGGGTDA